MVAGKVGIDNRALKKTYIHVPPIRRLTRSEKVKRALVGSVVSPAYCLLAHRYRVPGLGLRVKSALLGLHLLFTRKAEVTCSDIYGLIFWPMDSTRYFEFDFMWHALSKVPRIERYLDVSSPRLFPILILLNKPELIATLINPDVGDLSYTANLIKAIGLDDRCGLYDCLIGSVPFDAESFDVITSMSVVEHIPEDGQAIQKMWELLKPNGRLLLTVPCAAQPSEQYIDRNEYGLLSPDEGSFFFFQRLYDQRLLEERIFSITGQPRRHVIYGERSPGTLRKNLDRKRGDPFYPYWREPYMMGQDFCHFKELGELPGEGVIALEFEKR